MIKYLSIILVAVITVFLLLFRSSPDEKKILDHNVRSKSSYNFVKLNNGYTAYDISGPDTGHVVVFIHGGTIPMCIWSEQIGFFTEAGFRVLCYDQYGRGESDRPDTEYNRALFTSQLKELLDALEISYPVSLVGPSFGGAISVSFASKYPELVNSIVLISPVLNLDRSNSSLKLPFQIARLPFLGKPIFRSLILGKIIERGHLQVAGGKDSPCYSQFLNQFTYKGTSDALYSMFISDAFKNYLDETGIVGKQTKNILLMRGKKDKEITESMIDKIRLLLPECKFKELDSGHSPNADSSSDSFNQLIVDFLKDSISKESPQEDKSKENKTGKSDN